MKLKCYYAHPISFYGSIDEKEEIDELVKMGFEVINPNDPKYEVAYKERGMDVFLELVESCDVLAFRSFDSGNIPAGVAKEIDKAFDTNKVVF